RSLAVALLCAWIALAPGLAEARAGGGSSMGSRGSRTYNYNGGQTVDRSVTPRPSPSAPQYAPGPSYGYGGGFMQRHPFMTGLVGGLIGAGIAGMLFGHSAWAADVPPIRSKLGLLLQFAVIGGLIWLAVSFFRRRGFAGPGGSGMAYAQPLGGMAPRPSANPVEIPIGDSDFNVWTEILTGVQRAWSRGDLGA